MRRNEREMQDASKISELLQQAQIMRLAMCRDNVPYVVPLSFGYDGQALYFHCADTGRKIDFLRANSHVCFEVEGQVRVVEHARKPCAWSLSYASVIGYGRAEELHSLADKKTALACIMRQFSDAVWEFPDSSVQSVAIWKIHIDHLSGKQSMPQPPEKEA